MTIHDLFDRVITRSPRGLLSWSRLRRGVLLAIGASCLTLGMAMIITLVRPETLRTMGTAQLLGIVVLMGCPAMTLLALRFDRSVLKTRATGAYHQEPLVARANRAPEIRIAAHAPHERAARATHRVRVHEFDEALGAHDHAA